MNGDHDPAGWVKLTLVLAVGMILLLGLLRTTRMR
jgi:hypothetical protein